MWSPQTAVEIGFAMTEECACQDRLDPERQHGDSAPSGSVAFIGFFSSRNIGKSAFGPIS